jgi:hypothetical protein
MASTTPSPRKRASSRAALAAVVVTPGSVGSLVNNRRRDAMESQGQLEQQLEELDEIKVKTMFQMVEDVEIANGGVSVPKKFLYLTNKQAASFNSANMDTVMHALELKEAHFVIRLMSSTGGRAQRDAHTEMGGAYSAWYTNHVTFNVDDSNRTESQLILFVKQCILPVAMQTRALILIGGANDCSLGVAVQKVMGPVMERMRGECPFTVIGMVFAPEIHAKAHEGRLSIAGQYAAQSKSWGRRFKDLHECMLSLDGSIEAMQQCDMNSACTHMICFETIDLERQKWDIKPRASFENTFIECLMQKLPSIVIQAQTADIGVGTLADIVRRKIPLLLLDSRERWPLVSSDKNPCTTLAEDLRALKPPEEAKEEHFDKASVATRLLKEHYKKLASGEDGGSYEEWSTSDLAFLRGVLDYSIKNNKSVKKQRLLSLHKAILAEDEAKSVKSGLSGLGGDQVDDDVEKEMVNIYFEVLPGLRPKIRIQQLQAYIKHREPTWAKTDDIEEGSEVVIRDPNVEEAKDSLKEYEAAAARVEKNGGRETIQKTEDWAAVYDILSSKNCFSESIFDLPGISHVMSNVAKIDNLPDKHSKEALLLIQHAWCLVDAYHSVADGYKCTAKLCYVIMLVMSVLVVAVGVIMNMCSEDLPIYFYNDEMGNYIVLGLSLLNTVIAGLTAFTNPAMRWHYLRSSALQLESEIWQFRTRTGKYRDRRAASSRTAEKTFHKVLKESEEVTLKSGDLSLTMFYSNPKSTWSKHGQFRRRPFYCCSCKCKRSIVASDQIDNHHSPLRPDEYLQYRLKPMLAFYMKRLPAYSRNRSLTKCLTILGSIGSSILVVFEMTHYSVVFLTVISSFVAWSEFSGTEKKLERYSTVISGLGQIDLWWKSLPEVERLATKSINDLVSTVEDQIRNEHQGWRATSEAASKLSDAQEGLDASFEEFEEDESKK